MSFSKLNLIISDACSLLFSIISLFVPSLLSPSLPLSPPPLSLQFSQGVWSTIQFSKQDHVTLVKLLFELVTIPDLESPLLQAWCVILSKLLKYAQQLSPFMLV